MAPSMALFIAFYVGTHALEYRWRNSLRWWFFGPKGPRDLFAVFAANRYMSEWGIYILAMIWVRRLNVDLGGTIFLPVVGFLLGILFLLSILRLLILRLSNRLRMASILETLDSYPTVPAVLRRILGSADTWANGLSHGRVTIRILQILYMTLNYHELSLRVRTHALGVTQIHPGDRFPIMHVVHRFVNGNVLMPMVACVAFMFAKFRFSEVCLYLFIRTVFLLGVSMRDEWGSPDFAFIVNLGGGEVGSGGRMRMIVPQAPVIIAVRCLVLACFLRVLRGGRHETPDSQHKSPPATVRDPESDLPLAWRSGGGPGGPGSSLPDASPAPPQRRPHRQRRSSKLLLRGWCRTDGGRCPMWPLPRLGHAISTGMAFLVGVVVTLWFPTVVSLLADTFVLLGSPLSGGRMALLVAPGLSRVHVEDPAAFCITVVLGTVAVVSRVVGTGRTTHSSNLSVGAAGSRRAAFTCLGVSAAFLAAQIGLYLVEIRWRSAAGAIDVRSAASQGVEEVFLVASSIVPSAAVVVAGTIVAAQHHRHTRQNVEFICALVPFCTIVQALVGRFCLAGDDSFAVLRRTYDASPARAVLGLGQAGVAFVCLGWMGAHPYQAIAHVVLSMYMSAAALGTRMDDFFFAACLTLHGTALIAMYISTVRKYPRPGDQEAREVELWASKIL